MKNKTPTITIAFLFICLGFTKDKTHTRFEIRKDNPAIGLTLVWSLPEAQLQNIIGNKFKPLVKDGKGIFITRFIFKKK